MTLEQAYQKGKKLLYDTNIDSPAFDCMCIFEHCFHIDRQKLIINANKTACPETCKTFFELINERTSRRPLQYILGSWEFMGNNFKVGEGVLIPREDTETLVYECLDRIKNIESPAVIDLCSGSGAIAVSIAKKRPDATVFAVELSDKAYPYLCENIALNNCDNVNPINANIINSRQIIDFFNISQVDAIVSNPPYIPKKDIESLQEEVKNEPAMALDGGNDGLDFYKIIPKNWISYLKLGGFLCVEFGIHQEDDVETIFKQANLSDIKKIKDFNGIYRVLSAVK